MKHRKRGNNLIEKNTRQPAKNGLTLVFFILLFYPNYCSAGTHAPMAVRIFRKKLKNAHRKRTMLTIRPSPS